MKKLFIGLFVLVALSITSCGVNTSSNIDVDTTDIKYVKDARTGLCFAMTASRKTGNVDTSGLGLTCVPCEAVEGYLED